MNSLSSRRRWIDRCPYLVILGIALIYFFYVLIDNKYFFYDDFTALKFVAERSYLQVIIDSLISRNIDRHKFVGYLIHKALYDIVDLKIEIYFFVLFVVHTINSWLIYWLLNRINKQTWTNTILSSVFCYRFYLWWFSNIHVYLATLFGLLFIAVWFQYLSKPGRIRFVLWGIWPLMVFSYGPSVLLPLALIPATMAVKKNFSINLIKPLLPFVLLLFIYLVLFVFTPDSLERFTSESNPYKSDFSPQSFIISQSIYLHEISGKLLPQSTILTLIVWLCLFIFTYHINPKNLLWLLSFFIALWANSFFANHTMFYYLYLPIVFLLIYFGQMLRERNWFVTLVILFILFAPWTGIYQLIFRFRHPANNFEKTAMETISRKVDRALVSGETQVRLSNWDVTPNLEHAIVYQALPYFLTNSNRFGYKYLYSRETETLILVPN